MGARFAVNHSNLVAYLTSSGRPEAPRSDRETLGSFLMALAYNKNLISSTQGTTNDWVEQVSDVARSQLKEFQQGGLDLIEPSYVALYLGPLRGYFTDYAFYALILPVDDCTEDQRSFALFTEMAISSHTAGLVLLPEVMPHSGIAQFVDPFPALKSLADNPIAPPGVVFWTPLGGACALSLDDAYQFFHQRLLPALQEGVQFIDNLFRFKLKEQKTKRVLHLSDLHIGKKEATLRRSWLKLHLSTVLPSIDRVVVTGDLFDTPKEELRASFDEFRRDVEQLTDKELLVIPGNHDVRVKGNAFGNFLRNDKYVTDLKWSPIVVDDDLQMVFFSFNSSEDGNFAKGSVNKRQRLARATDHEILIRNNPKIKNYFNVALVHHHPVSYGSQPTALYEKLLAKIGGEEQFIAFEDAKSFLQWCSGRNVSLVLHGHKHIPHLSTVTPATSNARDITVVGCGSSVGADEKPVCYDIVTLNPETGRWSVSFFHDERGDGSGFSLQNVALDMRQI